MKVKLLIVINKGMIRQGKYIPKNPDKYRGNVNLICYRSSWELRVMKIFDSSPNIIWWNSEELIIPYFSPVDKRPHRYFPDFLVHVKNGKTFLLEVKPEAQTMLKDKKRMTENYKREIVTYAINQAKWQAADRFCQENGWTFKVITEKDLGI